VKICEKYLAESAGAKETAIGKPQEENEESELLLVRALVMGLKHPIFLLGNRKNQRRFPAEGTRRVTLPTESPQDDNELRVFSVFVPCRKTANWINFCDIFLPKVKMG